MYVFTSGRPGFQWPMLIFAEQGDQSVIYNADIMLLFFASDKIQPINYSEWDTIYSLFLLLFLFFFLLLLINEIEK